jgi:ATP-binding protein involved in chromosome partitioning
MSDTPATIAVASGKGGVGKSTVSLNLSVSLAHRGLRTGLLDADLYGPDIAAMVGLTRRRRTRHVEVWSATSSREQAVERFGIKVMSAQFLLGEDQSLSLTQPLANLLLDRMRNGIDWGDLDVLVVDLPPGTADLQQLVARHLGLAGVLMIVTPQDVAHLDAKKALSMYRANGVPVLGGVENMAALACPCCSTAIDVFPPCREERSIWATGVERLCSIPMEPAVARAGEDGTPVVVSDPDGPVSATFAALAASVARGLRLGGEQPLEQ